MSNNTKDSLLRCSFCGRSEREVEILIPAAKQGAAICSDCISTCANFLEELSVEELPAEKETDALKFETLPKPTEIKELLR